MSGKEKLSQRESIRLLLNSPDGHLDAQRIVERISKTDPVSIQEIVASQIELLTVYHNAAIDQARRSFRLALFAALIGLLFFSMAIGFMWFMQVNTAIISFIGGILIEFISALNFYLYRISAGQLTGFQGSLDEVQRVLIANSLSETLDGDFKQQARLEIIKSMLNLSDQSSLRSKKER
jgi:hypothetical protein